MPVPPPRNARRQNATAAAPADSTAETSAPRLQVVLAARGVASRRQASEIIGAGRVRVNGEIVRSPGQHVDPSWDRIEVDGRALAAAPEAARTIMVNKPIGLVCSADARQGRTVCDLVAHLPERLVPVGRLDKASEGLLLLSNDGPLIARLTHPRHGHRKRYEVDVRGDLTEAALELLRSRLVLDGYRIQPAEVAVLQRGAGRHRLAVTLAEGRHHQIRRMCGQAGLEVVRLKRVAIDALTLGDLRPGGWRDLTPVELAGLRRGVG